MKDDKATHYESLRQLEEVFRQKPIIGHKLVHISNYWPYSFYTVPDRTEGEEGAFNPYVEINDSNAGMFATLYYKDMRGCQGNNFFLGFDNGQYLYVDCSADNELYMKIRSNPVEPIFCGGDFSLERFFDDIMDSTLNDVELLVSDETDHFPDLGGDSFADGSIWMLGRLKLIFEGDRSIVIACNFGMPRISSYTSGVMDTCNYWHISCCSDEEKLWDERQDTNQAIRLSSYAKYICDIVSRRDILNEEYVLNKLNSIGKMQMFLDRISQRIPSLQAEALIEDIDIINRHTN